MPYTIVAFVAVVILTLRFLAATGPSRIAKAAVLVVFFLGLTWGFSGRHSLAGLFLLMGLGVFVSLYQLYQQAQFPRDRG